MSAPTRIKGPIVRTSLAEAVYEHILSSILDGTLPGGAELSEVALAAELSVSRTPVHEAVRRLAADGLVEQPANRQARVARFTRRDVEEIYEMRALLEPAAAERAARGLKEDQLADLRAAADALAAAPRTRGWSARALDFDIQFHDVLAAAAGNERLRAEIIKYRHLVRAFCRLSGSVENLEAALEEHRRILGALEARDPAAARRSMAAHIQARLHALVAKLDTPA